MACYDRGMALLGFEVKQLIFEGVLLKEGRLGALTGRKLLKIHTDLISNPSKIAVVIWHASFDKILGVKFGVWKPQPPEF
ncbi:MAG: hypothetical protein J7L37_05805 [Thermococcus sp.]|nr:hypothetical protein [Thermococcus sp.]